MGARVVAIIVALGMIGGAVAYRSARGGGGFTGERGGPVVLVCASELEAACRALASQDDEVTVTVEDAVTTADRLVGLERASAAGLDGWLVPGPWPEMVDVARAAASKEPLFDDLGEPLARSPLLLVVRSGSAGVGQRCLGGAVEWRCIGDAAGDGFRLSGPRDDQASAILSYGGFAAGYLGTSDFGTNDITGEAFQWLNATARRISTTRSGGATSLAALLAAPAFAEGFLTTEAEWARTSFGAANVAAFAPAVLAPAATADLHLGVRRGAEAGDRLAERFADDPALELIRQQGWRVPGRTPIAGVVPDLKLPDGNGLPSAGVLQGLREVVQ